jgi:hypothetical protein
MNRTIFIADFFANEIPGGGELNNKEFIDIIRSSGFSVEKIKSERVTPSVIQANRDCNFIVANFIGLREDAKKSLYDKKYVIYEHDHKYLKGRNPALYKDFKAPVDEIINYDFYQNALAVICQSSFHKGIVEKNLNLQNVCSVGGNLWSTETIDFLEGLSNIRRADKCSIMNSNIPHKNTIDAIRYCKIKNLDFELIPNLPYHDFLRTLAKNDTFVFFPKTPETLSRVVVEARMVGMKVITNSQVGATQEEWFQLKGTSLIRLMREKRDHIPSLIMKKF